MGYLKITDSCGNVVVELGEKIDDQHEIIYNGDGTVTQSHRYEPTQYLPPTDDQWQAFENWLIATGRMKKSE